MNTDNKLELHIMVEYTSCQKQYLRKRQKKIMFNGSNCNCKSQLYGILTEPQNPLYNQIF